MDNILIACGDADLLRRLVSELPDGYKPLATKRGGDVGANLGDRNLPLAIVHETLEDDAAVQLCRHLRSLDDPPAILWLSAGAPPDEGPFDRAIRFPVPGPVLRNALDGLHSRETGADQEDLQQWKAFYREVKARVARLDEQTYWEMLGLEEQAPHHAIVDAFDRLSMRYHPDRYSQYRDRKWGEALHRKVHRLYTALTEAYEVLDDRKLRREYERARREGRRRLPPEKLSSPDSGPDSLTDIAHSRKARRFLKMAQSEIAKEDYDSALQNLRFAQSVEPDNALIGEKIEEIEEKA